MLKKQIDPILANELPLLADTYDLTPQLMDYPQDEAEQLIVQKTMFNVLGQWCNLLSEVEKAVLSSEQAYTIGQALDDIVDIALKDDKEE